MKTFSVNDHYKNLLAEHYTWMFEGFDGQVEKNRSWFLDQGFHPQSNEKAIDLGCGSGFQSVALSSIGYQVTAVDFNQDLLDEVKSRDQTGTIETVNSDILTPENYSAKAPFHLAVCMGDTLPHLPSAESIEVFFGIVHHLLVPGGDLALSFRDYSSELTGTDRFIPVRQDDTKIMTVFLEYEPDAVYVHDLIYQRSSNHWKLEKSVYKKVRTSAKMVTHLLKKTGFTVMSLQNENGMVYLLAKKT